MIKPLNLKLLFYIFFLLTFYTLKAQRVVIDTRGMFSESSPTEYKSDVYKEEAFFNNLDIDGIKISGYVTVKTKFVFMGYPFIVAEYDDLTITDLNIKIIVIV